MKPNRTLPLSLFLLLPIATFAQGGSFDDLLAKVPAGTNTLVLIDVVKTLATPLAEKEGWGKELEIAYVSRPIFLPPEATNLVMAASLTLSDDFQRNWGLALMELEDPMSMRSIARSENGYTDKINDTDVAWTPNNTYFVSLADRLLGVLFPANRQFTSRWIDFMKNNRQVTTSRYLQQATSLANDKTQILMAIDLTDAVRPHELAEKAVDSPYIEKAKVSVDQFVSLVGSLRGATLRVAVNNVAQAQLRVDFSQDISPLKPIAKELILQVLGNQGVRTDNMESWKLEVQGKAITLQGKLSQEGMRRVFSVVELPNSKFSVQKDRGEGPQEVSESEVRENSLTYFRATEVLLKDLKRELRGSNASAAIMESYARKIDNMPILHVDEILLDYGADLAQSLRSIALAKRQGGVQAGVDASRLGNYSNYGYSQRRDRYAGARASASDRAAVKKQAMAESKNVRVEGSKTIADTTAEIRRIMTKKYQVEF